MLNTICDTDGRYIIACAEIQGQPYILINCYAPDTEDGQIQTFKEIANHLAQMDIPSDSKYMCCMVTGILFSTLPWIHLVRKAKLKRKAIFQLQNIMSSYELIDIWRTQNLTLRQFTWRHNPPPANEQD